MSGKIFVCITCDRNAARSAAKPTPGERLANAIRRQSRNGVTTIRAVECLNSCPHPCAAALRAPGKTLIRFSGLTEDDASALLLAASAYAESADGNVPVDALPSSLRERVSDRVSMQHA